MLSVEDIVLMQEKSGEAVAHLMIACLVQSQNCLLKFLGQNLANLNINSFPGISVLPSLWDYLELDMRAQRLWVEV